MRKRVIIMGAAGRDFHNFNVYFRNNEEFEVVAFTATQIPNIEGRKYPASLAGKLYPDGIPIYPEKDLVSLIKKYDVNIVVFSYSDVSHEYVMHKASLAMASGADFMLLGPESTQIKSKKPVVSICAIRTGCGKSQTTRRVVGILKDMGLVPVVVRHPMPYGDLEKQRLQRFATFEDMDKANCTIEEREEYESHINRGVVVYAGVDYEEILGSAEKEADVVVWDGGNNDFPFFKSDLQIVVVDPLRVGHETTYHPGETNFLSADVIVINKIDTAPFENVERLREKIYRLNPDATVVEAASPIFVEDYEKIKGKKVLVIEDGPTLTHGSMSFGAGFVAAKKFGAREVVDPRPWIKGSIKEAFIKYPQIGSILPALGYGKEQLKELEEIVNSSDAELVVVATPVNLGRIINMNKPYVRVTYELQEIGKPDLHEIIKERLKVK
ncbi:MAG: GTPase [Caldiserica bacterium]|nr:MAG: GTPase [Caldisericota bacterium]